MERYPTEYRTDDPRDDRSHSLSYVPPGVLPVVSEKYRISLHCRVVRQDEIRNIRSVI